MPNELFLIQNYIIMFLIYDEENLWIRIFQKLFGVLDISVLF